VVEFKALGKVKAISMKIAIRVIYLVSLFFILVVNLSGKTIKIPSIGCCGWHKEKNRPFSGEYISGDAFRAYADHIVEPSIESFNTSYVRPYDCIYILGGRTLKFFFDHIYPHIAVPHFLIVHNHAQEFSERYRSCLDDSKLLACFSKNALFRHKKLYKLPLGMSNQIRLKVGIDYQKAPFVWEDILKYSRKYASNKEHLLCLNFRIETYRKERKFVSGLFEKEDFCYCPERKLFDGYLIDLASSKFTLSPRGVGVDCYRTWEAIGVGSIPIILSSPLNSLYEGLPVLIVDSWNKITEQFLKQEYERIMSAHYSLEKLYIEYWYTFLDTKREKLIAEYEQR